MSIVDKLKHDFQKKYSNSDKIKKLISMIDNGNATYNNAHEFSIEVGEILAEVFKNNLTQEVLASYTDYKGVINNILDETLVNNYELISDYSRDIQTILNYKAGFNIKGIKAQKNQSRISNLSKRLGSEKDFEKSKWLLNEPIKNYSQSIVDDTVKANADFQYKLGLSPKIIRKEAGNCCDWCKALVGEYNYPNEVPKDVYKRHAYCRCSVEYIPSGTNIGTNIHSKKIMNSDEDIRTRIKQYEKQLEKNKIKNKKLKQERIQKDKDLRNIVDKNVGNGYNKDEVKYINSIYKTKYKQVDAQIEKELQKRSNIPKTLQNFDKYSKKWEEEAVKKVLTNDEIRLIGREIKNLIDSNDYSMRIDAIYLKNVLDEGKFKNQFETKTSGGALNSDIRKKATKQLFGKGGIKNPSDYEKYGYVGHKNFIEDLHESGTSQYGNAIVRFDKNKLKGNVTYTIDDSLGLAYNKLTVAGNADNPTANGIRNSNLRKIYDLVSSENKPKDLTNFLDATGARYIELQYHGDVKSDFIKEICFTKDLPDDVTIKKLKDRGVKLFRIIGDWGDEELVEI